MQHHKIHGEANDERKQEERQMDQSQEEEFSTQPIPIKGAPLNKDEEHTYCQCIQRDERFREKLMLIYSLKNCSILEKPSIPYQLLCIVINKRQQQRQPPSQKQNRT